MHSEKDIALIYLREKNVVDLFKRLAVALLLNKPSDPIDFLIQILRANSIPEHIQVAATKPILVA